MAAEKRTLPKHIAWRCGGQRDLKRALHALYVEHRSVDRTEWTRAQNRTWTRQCNDARLAVLDAHARAHGCVRGGEPRKWRTAEEWAAYREAVPGYRQDPERHRQAAMSLPAKFRRERALAAAQALWAEE